MALRLITGPANAGKARAVMERLRAHAAQGQRPLLVVPTGADADRYRRELAERGPVSGVEVALFSGLLERIAWCAAEQRPVLARAPLQGIAREGALCAIACDVRPQMARRRHGLGRALAASIAELEAAGVGAGLLRDALLDEATPARELRLGAGPPRDALADHATPARELRLGAALLAETYERYRARLAELGLLDPELRARGALDALRRHPHLWRGRPVLIYGFDDLTALQLDAIETLAAAVDAPVTVSLLYERGRVAFAGRESAAAALMPQAVEHVVLGARAEYYDARARDALHGLERGLFEADPPGGPLDPGGCVRLLEGADERGELGLLAAQVRALIDGGMPAAEIAVVHRNPPDLADAIAEAFEPLRVPYELAVPTRFAGTALGRALLGLLACGCEGVDGVAEASPSDLLAWLRAPGVLEHAELADRLEERALRSGIDTAAAMRAAWEQERWPLDRVQAVRDAAVRGPAALIDRVERDLLWLFEAPRARAGAVLEGAERDGVALGGALRLLAELRELALSAPELIGGAQGVIDALAALRPEGSERWEGEAVRVCDPLSLRARRVRALLLCGLQEGVFPAPSRSRSLLSDTERGRVAERGGSRLAAHADQLATERYLLYATVSRPEELLVLSWHLAGHDGEPTPPSLFLDDICDCFSPALRESRSLVLDGAGVTSAGTSLPGMERAVAPAGSVSSGTLLPRVERAAAPAGSAVGPGMLRDERLLAELGARTVWSASSLERWLACPAGWFVERLLDPADIEPEPEPLLRGTLAHSALREVMERLRELTGSARITAGRLRQAQKLAHEALGRLAAGAELSVVPERRMAAMRRLRADLDRYLAFAAEQEAELEPAHLELPFGFPDEGGLPALRLGDGVTLRGRIDRVDLTPDGAAIVYDYKSGRTGSEFSGARWARSLRLQMPLYMRVVAELAGIEVRGGLYQPLGGGDPRPRGAVAKGTGLDCVRTDIVEPERLEELMHEASEAAREAARQARGGVVQARPATCSPGGRGCRYPGICGCTR